MVTTVNSIPDNIVAQAVTLTSGTDETSAIRVNGLLCGVIMPAALTGTGLTVRGSADGTNFYDVCDKAGTSLVLAAAAAGKMVVLDNDAVVNPVRFIKLKSSTNEGADRAITVLTAPE